MDITLSFIHQHLRDNALQTQEPDKNDELLGQFNVPAFMSLGQLRKPVFPLRSTVRAHVRAGRF
jgi:hypothetical protein